MDITAIVSLLAGVSIGAVGLYAILKATGQKTLLSAEKEAEKVIQRAKGQVAKIERDAAQRAKDFETRARKNVEVDIRKEKQKITQTEQQLKERETKLEREYRRKEDQLNGRSRELDETQERVQVSEKRLQEMEDKSVQQISELELKLQSVANMTPEQAKNELLNALTEDAQKEMSARVAQIEEETMTEANRRARRILATAIARYASEVATERTVSSIPLKGEEMKGKIIGREGRNIRALEAACGVDLIIDETPETVIISSFDPVRREVARRSLERLMEDGRVHPARIEEVVEKVKSELFGSMREEGEKVCFELGVHNVHANIIKVLGGLKYRQGEGQNMLAYSQEVASLAGLIAQELGADEKAAKRAGLLHAIGRGLDHTFEGSYAQAGAEFLKKNGEKDEIVHAVRAHTEEVKPETTLAHITQSAYNLTRSRPGARRANLETFIKRLSDLESVANSFDGVARSYAIQSGKEIRVIVDSGRVTDDQATMLSRDIARKIEREMNYAGQVRVAVVRETRIVEHAR
ncbi:MAG TPA: ribonuclease Y [Bdellovibrionales bacterium]|nr:ribonuclease Y [Bdellovibrionales bacterium]